MYFNVAMHIRRASALAAVFLVICLALREGGFAAERTASSVSEYQVKAAFVYNFIKFVAWPTGEGSPGGTVRLCVLGDLTDTSSFKDLDGQEIMGKRLNLMFLSEPQEVRNCQVLFLSSSLSRRLPETLEIIRGRPILTIGDTDGYAQRGIMINMYLDKKRVRFEINTEKAEMAGLRISTKLLSLAGTVYGPGRMEK